MKNSGIEWIGDIPDDWEILKTRYCFSIIGSGTTPESNNYKYYDGDFSWIQSGDLVKKNLYKTEKLITSQAFLDYSALKIYKAPFLVIAMYGASVGNSAVSFIDAATNQACCVLSECKENLLFLRYFFMAAQKPLIDEAKGGTQPNISQDLIKRFKICVPHSNVQQKIAEFLDKKCAAVDRLIENQSKQIEKLKEYKQSVITEAVTKGLNPSVPMKDSGIEWIVNIPEKWKIKPLKTLFSFYKGLPITKADLKETGERVISYGQIHAKYNKSSGVNERLYRYIDKQYILTNPDSIVTAGDFIFADTSEDVEGAGDFVYIDKGDLIFAGYHCIILKHKFEFDNRYIAYLFMSKEWKQQIQSRVCGIKVYSISRAMLSQASVLLPHIEEQQQIADYLDKKCEKIDKLIALKQQKIEKLNEYKKSLIYEYVTGKKEVI